MDITKLSTIIALIIVLSVAAERFVEIIKGFFPCLNTEKTNDPKAEGRRRAILQLLAVVAGVLITLLASPAIPANVYDPSSHGWTLVALGLLASGGSGFWNSILTYVTKLKDSLPGR